MRFENVFMLLPGRKTRFGSIEIEGRNISSIEISQTPSFSDFPEKPRLVMPGFVNCHGHTAMTLVRGLGGGLPLQRWLEEAIFPIEAKMTMEDVRAGAKWGVLEMLSGGTTAVADMYDFPSQMGEVLLEKGMKGRICRVGLSFVPGRLEDSVEFTKVWNSQAKHVLKGDVLSDISIHSEYLTDEDFCRRLSAANKELNRPLHVHVSETRKEHEECILRHGKTPIAYLASTGLLDNGGYAAHCVWCTDDDFRIMADKGVSLIHNPTSNMKLGSGLARIPRAMEIGVNVALGTDGCASNDNLDMFEEMHVASLIHKGFNQDPTVLGAWDLIEMATLNGAKAIGLENTGSLEVGKAADLCVIDLNAVHLAPAVDIPNLLVNSCSAQDVAMTVVDGNIVYEKGSGESSFQRSEEFISAKACLNDAVGRLFS